MPLQDAEDHINRLLDAQRTLLDVIDERDQTAGEIAMDLADAQAKAAEACVSNQNLVAKLAEAEAVAARLAQIVALRDEEFKALHTEYEAKLAQAAGAHDALKLKSERDLRDCQQRIQDLAEALHELRKPHPRSSRRKKAAHPLPQGEGRGEGAPNPRSRRQKSAQSSSLSTQH